MTFFSYIKKYIDIYVVLLDLYLKLLSEIFMVLRNNDVSTLGLLSHKYKLNNLYLKKKIFYLLIKLIYL